MRLGWTPIAGDLVKLPELSVPQSSHLPVGDDVYTSLIRLSAALTWLCVL